MQHAQLLPAPADMQCDECDKLAKVHDTHSKGQYCGGYCLTKGRMRLARDLARMKGDVR